MITSQKGVAKRKTILIQIPKNSNGGYAHGKIINQHIQEKDGKGTTQPVQVQWIIPNMISVWCQGGGVEPLKKYNKMKGPKNKMSIK